MKLLGKGRLILIALAVLAALAPPMARAQMRPPERYVPTNQLPPAVRNIGIDQRLGEQLPLDARLTDESGAEVTLGQYFGERPVIISMVYYTCPMLCNQILTGLAAGLRGLDVDSRGRFVVGKEFDVVLVSIDPRETPAQAAEKKAEYVGRYGRKESAGGWHFLVGSEAEVKRVADAVGFRYEYDERSGQYVHASGIMVATPEGKLSHYFYGIDYAPKNLRFSLMEASNSQIGSLVDQLLLFCYHYDPATGQYALVRNLMRIAGVVTFVGLAVIIFVKRRRIEARRRKEGGDDEGEGTKLNPLAYALIPFAPEQASTIAETVDGLYVFLIAITAFFSVAIPLVIIYFFIKYRRRSEDEIPQPIEGSMKLETTWIVIPFLITMVIFGWGTYIYFKVYRLPTEAMDIYVVGKQWMWKFQHPDGVREINTLHVPVGRRVKLTMTTEDVIHSLFVPAFRIKYDVVPGRYTTVWFQATKPGTYHLFCTEYCGTQHSAMIGSVVVMEPADYEAWLTGGTSGQPLAASGEQLFQQFACNTCHLENGQGRGPSLVGLFGRQVRLENGGTAVADVNYLRESILNPNARVVAGYERIMPTFQGLVNEEQLLQLVEYIKSQGQPGEGGQPAAGPQGPQQESRPDDSRIVPATPGPGERRN